MPKAKMNDAVKALETIRDWTKAVHDDLSEYQGSLPTPDPTMTSAIAAVDKAFQAVTQAVTAAKNVTGNPELPTPDTGNTKTVVKTLSSGVARAC